jgi:AraC family transcriptional regulator
MNSKIETALHRQPVVSEAGQLFECPAEASASGRGYAIRIQTTRRPDSGEVIFRPNTNVLELILEKDCELVIRNSPDATAAQAFDVQGVTFVPAGVPLLCRWSPGRQRSIYCHVDFEELLRDSPIPRKLFELATEARINLQNPYLVMGMRRIAEEILSPGVAPKLQVELSMKSLAIELLGCFAGQKDGRARNAGRMSGRAVQRLHDYVESSGGIPCIEEIASVCGMNSRRLSTLYRNATGTTLRAYLAGVRIKRAQSLLLSTDLLIKQIAYECDFASAAAFVAAFRKTMGMTPLEFRRSAAGS